MIPVNQSYSVYDKEGRYWGTVDLKYIYDSSSVLTEGGTISGYLKPSGEFTEIREMYNHFLKIFHGPNDANEELNYINDKISDLGVVLIDSENIKYPVGPVIVTEKYLFSCPAKENEKI